MSREIMYAKVFDTAVEELGGYRAVDKALDAIIDGLMRNPYAFPRFENDFVSFRYVITKPIDAMASLVVTFSIGKDGKVTLEHVEENTNY
jgi:hypothetical protein